MAEQSCDRGIFWGDLDDPGECCMFSPCMVNGEGGATLREQQQPVVLVSSCVGVHVALWSGGKVFETQGVLPALMCEMVVKVRSKDSERKCP